MAGYLAVSWAYATIGSDVGDEAIGEHAWHASLCAPTRGFQGGDGEVLRGVASV
jgi:hypothetical protein